MKKNKISVITFSYLNYKNLKGPSEKAISIAKELYNRNLLHKIVCLDYSIEGFEILQNFFYVPFNKIFIKICFSLLSILKKFLPFNDRYLKECIFDFLLSKSTVLNNSDVLFFLKPAFTKTVKLAKKKNIITIDLASIFHPKFNYEEVNKLIKKYNLNSKSNYLYLKRVQRISEFFENLDWVFVQTDLAKKIFQKYGLSQEKILKVNDAFDVDCNNFRPLNITKPKNMFTVLHISHMNLIKGLGYLFEAWKRLSFKNAQLILGGNVDSDIQYLYNTIKPPSTYFLGYLYNTSLVYNMADVFVSPSVSDALPNTVLEAMACGLPVIVSNRCGVSEIITHGHDGFVYHYDDVYQLERYLKWCYNNRNSLIQMGHNARKKALFYSKRNFASKMVDNLLYILENNV